jgi:ubiquinone biosynthesis protein Coq4
MFNNQRLAVLTAALTVRKLYNQVQTIATMDSKLTTLKHDKSLFEIMIAKDHKKELFEDRYSRTIFELSQLYERIIELEKSVHLQ